MQDPAFRQFIERIKLLAPIERVIGERVSELTRRGALFWARCPFHEERTASFAVDPRKGTWRCYGACSEGGDAISFVQRFDGLDFLDALRLLARSVGEEVPAPVQRRRSAGADAREERLLHVLAWAARFFRRALAADEGRAARAYLEGRRLSPATAERFGLGWSPVGRRSLLAAAESEGIRLQELESVGLARRGESGDAFDFFRGRLMVPIADRLGRVLGFGGRILSGSGEDDRVRTGPKYVNTPETPLFKKGELVYALDLAADEVRRSRTLVLVEGYTDVHAAHQVGMGNVAAVLGTATTREQAALIRRTGARRCVLVFDGDDAGRRAGLKALTELLPLGLELFAASPPAGRDPFDLCLGSGSAEHGLEAFRSLVEGASDWLEWIGDSLAGRSGPELAAGVEELLPLLARLRPVEREVRLRRLAERIGVGADSMLAEWRRFERRAAERRPVGEVTDARPAQPKAPAPSSAPTSAELLAHRSLVGALLAEPSLVPLYAERVKDVPEDGTRAVFEALLHLYEEGDPEEPITPGAVLTVLGDHPARDLVSDLDELGRRAADPGALAADQVRWLEARAKERELAELRRRFEEQVTPLAAESAAQEILRSLHGKLRASRVPVPEAPAVPVPSPASSSEA